MIKKLYTIGRWKVCGIPLDNGGVEFRIYQSDIRGEFEKYLLRSVGYGNIPCKPSKFWLPWTWNNPDYLTVEQALNKSIAIVNEFAAKDRRAMYNLQEAERIIEGIQSQSMALEELEKEFSN
jgi:hypothetical protein